MTSSLDCNRRHSLTAFEAPNPREPRPRILVAGDDPHLRTLMGTGLQWNDFHVLMAVDGQEAVDLYRRQAEAVAAALQDACVPGLDGLETRHALRRLNANLQVCFTSDDPGIHDPKELAREGSRVLRKPFCLPEGLTFYHKSRANRSSGRRRDSPGGRRRCAPP